MVAFFVLAIYLIQISEHILTNLFSGTSILILLTL